MIGLSGISYLGRRSGATGPSSTTGAAPTSTKWRMEYPSGNCGGSFLNVSEYEWRGTASGADQCTGGSASASSVFGSGTAAGAFDNGGGEWIAVNGTSEWLQYDFASPVSMAEIYTVGATAQVSDNPALLRFRYWDGSQFITAYTSAALNTAFWGITSSPKTFTITAPSFSVNPTISYTYLAVGDVLTGNAGTYANAEQVTYAWKRNGTAIGGATASTYTLVSGDIGAQITLVVTIANGQGSVIYTTASVGPIIAAGTYVTQNVEFSDASNVTLSDSSNLEMYNRTA